MSLHKDMDFTRLTAASLAGILIWSAHFGIVYGGQHVACSIARSDFVKPLNLMASAIALGALAACLIWNRSLLGNSAGDFLHKVSRWLILVSMFAVAGVAATVFILPACGALR
tara:strand:- start:2560 stop:2898 length:339 start_codon:yes stop_codon:yes gene_type:complete